MNFLELVKNRYSCRAYKSLSVEREKLDYILECVRLAPSAVNKQPWRFHIVSKEEDKALLQQCYNRDWFKTAPMYVIATILHDDTIFTADMGHIDEEGRLRLEGRQGDVINVGGYKVAPTEVEDAALSLPQVNDCICIAVDHPLTGQALKLLVVTPEGQPFDKRQIARALKAQLETYKVPLLYEQVEKIQRTYNGKINRKFYQNRS